MNAHLLHGTVSNEEERLPRRIWLTWLLAWVASFAALSVALERVALSPAAGWAAAMVNAALGVAVVWSYVRFLRSADELERKIQVEALALGFGAGAVGMLAYRLLERAGAAPALDVADGLLVMLAGYAAGIIAARRRYA